MIKKVYVTAIVPAAGEGNRMKMDISKQYIYLNGKPILIHTLEILNKCNIIDEIIVVVAEGEMDYCREEIIKKYSF